MPTEIYNGRLVRDPVQADPVFLLQVRRIIIDPRADAEPIEQGGVVYIYESGAGWVAQHDSDDALTDDDLIASERAWPYWETESVWYDRDEAEAWATAHAYRFSGAPWRTYAVSAHGELRGILRTEDAARAARQGERGHDDHI